jgi:hypothetical protein
MTGQVLEGWYSDPFGTHEARWLSNGEATKLVRDGTITSYDEPPDGPFIREPEPIEHPDSAGGRDLLRADDAERNDASLEHSEVYMQQMDTVWSDGAPMEILYGEDDRGDSDAKPKGTRRRHLTRKRPGTGGPPQ